MSDEASAVEQLLRRPPTSSIDLRLRLMKLDRAGIRRELTRRLLETDPGLPASLLLVQCFLELGTGNAAIPLLDAVADRGRPLPSRALAFILLVNTAPRGLSRRMASLGGEESGKILAAAQAWLSKAGKEVAEAVPSKPARRPETHSAARVCRLKIILRGIRPPIWRRIEVLDTMNLGGLHRVLQDVMGWTDSHLHAFRVGGDTFGVPDPEWPDDTIPEKKVFLRDLVDRGDERFSYDYDFGDDWRHEIAIEKIGEPEPGVRYPRCLAGKRACPPEDCGGVYGYANLLEALADPRHPEHEEWSEWAGAWEPEAFDLEAVNRRLRKQR